MNFQESPGFGTKKNGKIVENGCSPLIEDLSTLPFQDFFFFFHALIDPMTGIVQRADARTVP